MIGYECQITKEWTGRGYTGIYDIDITTDRILYPPQLTEYYQAVYGLHSSHTHRCAAPFVRIRYLRYGYGTSWAGNKSVLGSRLGPSVGRCRCKRKKSVTADARSDIGGTRHE
jgi:hypothetical protein